MKTLKTAVLYCVDRVGSVPDVDSLSSLMFILAVVLFVGGAGMAISYCTAELLGASVWIAVWTMVSSCLVLPIMALWPVSGSQESESPLQCS